MRLTNLLCCFDLVKPLIPPRKPTLLTLVIMYDAILAGFAYNAFKTNFLLVNMSGLNNHFMAAHFSSSRLWLDNNISLSNHECGIVSSHVGSCISPLLNLRMLSVLSPI